MRPIGIEVSLNLRNGGLRAGELLRVVHFGVQDFCQCCRIHSAYPRSGREGIPACHDQAVRHRVAEIFATSRPPVKELRNRIVECVPFLDERPRASRGA